MFEAVSILTGSTFPIENLNPRLADKLLLTCPICLGTVFPVFGKKIKSHYKHHHNDDVDCDLYYRGDSSRVKPERIHSLTGQQNRIPVLAKMLKEHFYKIMFSQTLFQPLGDEGLDHLGNLVYSRCGAINLELLAADNVNYFVVKDGSESLTITCAETRRGVQEILSKKENIKGFWNDVILANKYASSRMASNPIFPGEVARFYKNTDRALSIAIEEQCLDVLELVIVFLLQQRNIPILSALISAAYYNTGFPNGVNICLQAKNSYFGVKKPVDISLSSFFIGCLTTSVMTLIASIPWLKFGNHYRNSRESRCFNSILIPQLGIPCIIVSQW